MPLTPTELGFVIVAAFSIGFLVAATVYPIVKAWWDRTKRRTL